MSHVHHLKVPIVLSFETISKIQKAGSEADVSPQQITQAHSALVNFLKDLHASKSTLESGSTHTILQQAQALLGSGQLSMEQISELRTAIANIDTIIRNDTVFSEAISHPIATSVLGAAKPSFTPMAIEASITESLFALPQAIVQGSANKLLSDPLAKGIAAHTKMKGFGLFRRMAEGIKKLWQGKNYKSYPARTLEKDLDRWLTANQKDLGKLAASSDFQDFGHTVTQQLEASFPDADEKWKNEAIDIAGDIIFKHWEKAKENFVSESRKYKEECRQSSSNILKRTQDLMPDEISDKAMQHLLSTQDDISRFWKTVELDRLTASDVCDLMADFIVTHRMVQDSKDKYANLVIKSSTQYESMLVDIEKCASQIQTSLIGPGELSGIMEKLDALSETSIKANTAFAIVPGQVEQLQQALANARKALQTRCENEIKSAQAWYKDTEDRLKRTLAKGATKSKHLTEFVKKAPMIAIEAANLFPTNIQGQALIGLYDHALAIVSNKKK